MELWCRLWGNAESAGCCGRSASLCLQGGGADCLERDGDGYSERDADDCHRRGFGEMETGEDTERSGVQCYCFSYPEKILFDVVAGDVDDDRPCWLGRDSWLSLLLMTGGGCGCGNCCRV